MHANNDYLPPNRQDYDNILALNKTWLGLATDLRGPQRGRLAACPFLLFSLRERDLGWWQSVLNADAQTDMWVAQASEPLRVLHAAALGFLWHLAARNAYASRIVSGADPAWCELITSQPLVRLIDRVAGRADLTVSRLEDSCLIAEGVSDKRSVRNATQLAALQSLLTSLKSDGYRPMAAAACNMPDVPLRKQATAPPGKK